MDTKDKLIDNDVVSKMQHEFEPNPDTSFKQGMYSGYAFGLQDGYKLKLESEIAKEKDEPKMTAEKILAKYDIDFPTEDDREYYTNEIIRAMEEYAAIVERRSCEKCAMSWSKNSITDVDLKEIDEAKGL